MPLHLFSIWGEYMNKNSINDSDIKKMFETILLENNLEERLSKIDNFKTNLNLSSDEELKLEKLKIGLTIADKVVQLSDENVEKLASIIGYDEYNKIIFNINDILETKEMSDKDIDEFPENLNVLADGLSKLYESKITSLKEDVLNFIETYYEENPCLILQDLSFEFGTGNMTISTEPNAIGVSNFRIDVFETLIDLMQENQIVIAPIPFVPSTKKFKNGESKLPILPESMFPKGNQYDINEHDVSTFKYWIPLMIALKKDLD